MTMNEAAVRVIGIAFVGLLLGYLRHQTGRLGAGIACHATYNTIIVLVTIATLNR